MYRTTILYCNIRSRSLAMPGIWHITALSGPNISHQPTVLQNTPLCRKQHMARNETWCNWEQYPNQRPYFLHHSPWFPTLHNFSLYIPNTIHQSRACSHISPYLSPNPCVTIHYIWHKYSNTFTMGAELHLTQIHIYHYKYKCKYRAQSPPQSICHK